MKFSIITATFNSLPGLKDTVAQLRAQMGVAKLPEMDVGPALLAGRSKMGKEKRNAERSADNLVLAEPKSGNGDKKRLDINQ